jgi:hypothetical protein
MLGNVRVHRLDFVLAISDLSGGFNFKAIFLQNGFTSLCETFLFAFIGHLFMHNSLTENHRQNSADFTTLCYIPLFRRMILFNFSCSA